MGLWREIKARGYPGTSRNVSRLLTYWRQQEQEAQRVLADDTGADDAQRAPAAEAANAPVGSQRNGEPAGIDQPESAVRRGMTPREAVGLLFRPLDDLTGEQQATRANVCLLDPEIARVDALCTRFRQLFRDHDVESLASWLVKADQSGIDEVTSFAAKLRLDLAAVEAAVTSPWSQGQVEGQVNRLTLVKRSMYGRAKFDLPTRYPSSASGC